MIQSGDGTVRRKKWGSRRWTMYPIAIISLSCIPLINHVCGVAQKLHEQTEKEMLLLSFNGSFKSEENRRIENLDGTFDVITLNFARLVNVPDSVSFSDFSSRWQELPRGLDVPSAFYGDFSNPQQDGCITWQKVVDGRGEYTPATLANLHVAYIRQCGGWAGFEVETFYRISEQKQSDVMQYTFYRSIARYQRESVLFLMVMSLPALWNLFWMLIGVSVRSAVRAFRTGNEK